MPFNGLMFWVDTAGTVGIIDSGGAPRFLVVTQVCRSSTTIRNGRRVEGERRREEEEEEEDDLGTGRRRGTLVGLERGGGGSSEEG